MTRRIMVAGAMVNTTVAAVVRSAEPGLSWAGARKLVAARRGFVKSGGSEGEARGGHERGGGAVVGGGAETGRGAAGFGEFGGERGGCAAGEGGGCGGGDGNGGEAGDESDRAEDRL